MAQMRIANRRPDPGFGMTSQTYPSGRVVTSEYDNAGRLAGVKNQANGVFYAGGAATDTTNRIQYTAHGAPSVMKLGNGLWEHTNFNSRLQPQQIGLGSASTNSSMLQLDYSYGTTTNNGNVQSQIITVPTIGGATGFTATQTYGYDSLNRLSSAQENGGASWSQNFTYDRYGNRNFGSATTLPTQLTPANNPVINAGNNRLDITVSGQTSVAYDPAGNLKHDVNGHEYFYDGENKQTTYDGGASANGGATYYYDGDGRRVKKVVGGSPVTSTVFVYNIQGQLVAEYSDAQPTTTGGTSYLTEDTLGTPRIDTDASGNVRARHDYQPFGEELYAGTGSRTAQNGYAGDNINQKFTQKERDNETGLDYFLARYYSSTQGRFTSPDEFSGGPTELFEDVDPHDPLFYADILNPQSLNKYQYCLSNPLRYVDPDGHQEVVSDTLRQAQTSPIPEIRAAAEVISAVGVAGGPLFHVTSEAVKNGACPADLMCSAAEMDSYATNNPAVKHNILSEAQGGANGVAEKKTKNVADAEKKGIPKDQLGPSGKPKVHVVQHPTEKRAKDAARQGNPAKDASPKKGGPHYHPTNRDGSRKRGKQNIHHEYPD